MQSQDRYAFQQSRPPVDPQQDWVLTGGEKRDGFTTLQFWRKWVTCDELDRDIEVRRILKSYLLWSKAYAKWSEL